MGWRISLYRWLYTRIGGRPWTYIIRDIYHQAEWIIQTFWFGLGVLFTWFILVNSWPMWILAIVWGAYTFGYVSGHLHWGTKYIAGQGGKK